MLKTITRSELNTDAWDTCVASSRQVRVYGYSWYLDAILPAPEWQWMGIVKVDKSGAYQAVMPVPLRRKRVAGIAYRWVVHQPFFCPFLSIFSAGVWLNTAPFFEQLLEQYRYGSLFCIQQQPGIDLSSVACHSRTTHTIDLSVGYDRVYAAYTRDRKQNLRRACHEFGVNARWAFIESADIGPLLILFRENHADTIDGGVADWAYELLRMLAQSLHKRGLSVLRYAVYDGQIEAGALFVCEETRITYLFNAASPLGRKANARTMLIDQLIQEKAGQPVVFDFESPEKPSIRSFYQSFGAIEEPFWALRWNRLSTIENWLRTGWSYFRKLR
ncbi:GNAT family N-acetyltransferase [Spirosoma sp.]|uniref:GNAT family N-acetyltransferase n=1 Tax=Spirosoma sp. TaxID=1899569 RepID=UPI00261A8949|nr:GNAT family N-acetyltransferase [Spirosoma sp.]MCX6218756.1 GNAT family N-acetyltransferase [Spirosoma sp.]